MKTSARTSPAILMALGMGLMPTRLRNALDSVSSRQRKAIRLPHVGKKEIARGERALAKSGLRVLSHDAAQHLKGRHVTDV